MNKKKINAINLNLYGLFSLSVLVGFFFGEDSGGSGGFISDFYSTWPIIELINDGNFFNFSQYTIHFPLHYYIIYFLNLFLFDKESTRLAFCLVSLTVPYLFYLSLRFKFDNVDINKLFFFSLIIFFLPSFRSGAIWANTQISSLFFFLVFALFYVKWEKKISKKFNKEIFFQCFFLSCAVYSRQLYAIVFIFILYKYFYYLNFKNFLKVCSLIFFLSVPGLFLVYVSPRTLTTTLDTNLFNSFLVNNSIICFYLIPYFLLSNSEIYKKIKFKKINLQIILIFIILIYISTLFFDYNHKLGGGFFIKLSILFFDNYFLFFLSSFLGLILIYENFKDDKTNFFLFFLLIFGFSSYQIFQKYFEPMLLILIFILIKNKQNLIILNSYKKIFLFKFYFFIYLVFALLNHFYKITKTFV